MIEYHIDSLDAFVTIGVVVFLIVKFCTREQHIKWIIDAYLFSAFMLSFYIFGLGRNSGARVEGVGMVDAPDANGVAAALAPTIVLFLARIVADKRITLRFLYLTGLVFTLNAMILINSRGAFLGVAAGVAYFFFISFISKSLTAKQKSIIFLCLLVFMGAFIRLADSTFIYRMLSIKDQTSLVEERESGSTRVYFWLAAWDMAKDHPFGAGSGAFQYYGGDYIPANVDTGGSRSRSVHSTWFEVLTEAGYLGFLFFSLMVMYSFRAFETVRKFTLAKSDIAASSIMLSLSSGLITFIVAMTFINRLRGEVLYWFVALSVCALNVYLQEQNHPREQESILKKRSLSK